MFGASAVATSRASGNFTSARADSSTSSRRSSAAISLGLGGDAGPELPELVVLLGDGRDPVDRLLHEGRPVPERQRPVGVGVPPAPGRLHGRQGPRQNAVGSPRAAKPEAG